MAQIMPSRKKHVWSIKDLSNDKKIKLENPHIIHKPPSVPLFYGLQDMVCDSKCSCKTD